MCVSAANSINGSFASLIDKPPIESTVKGKKCFKNLINCSGLTGKDWKPCLKIINPISSINMTKSMYTRGKKHF